MKASPRREKTSDPRLAAVSRSSPAQPDSGVDLDSPASAVPSSAIPSSSAGDEAPSRQRSDVDESETRGRGRRLTKAPPSATGHRIWHRSTQSVGDASGSAVSLAKSGKYYPPQSYPGIKGSQVDVGAGARQQRPGSAASSKAGNSPSQPTDTPGSSSRRTRSRSRSITSLFRRSLDGRRSSVDQDSSETGFIGGIKLEEERVKAHERSLSEQPIGPEADIHPALRMNTQKPRRRSPSPFKFLTQRSEPKDSQSRAYPPIAIKNASQSQIFAGSHQPERPARSSSRERWRERLGLSPSQSQDSFYAAKPSPKLTKFSRPPSASREDKPRKPATPVTAPATAASTGKAMSTANTVNGASSPSRAAMAASSDSRNSRISWKHVSAPVIGSSLAPVGVASGASTPRAGAYPMKSALVNRHRAISPLAEQGASSPRTVDHVSFPMSTIIIDRPRCESLNTDVGTDVAEATESTADAEEGNFVISDKDGSEVSYTTAPSTPPPPPRRSSKRRSSGYYYPDGTQRDRTDGPRGNGKYQQDPSPGEAGEAGAARGRTAKDALPAMPTVMSMAQHHRTPVPTAADRRDSSQSASTARKRRSNPPSIPYDSLPAAGPEPRANARLSFMGAAKAAFRLSMPDLSNTMAAHSWPVGRGNKRDSMYSVDSRRLSGLSGNQSGTLGVDDWPLVPPPPLLSPPLLSPSRSSEDDTYSDDLGSWRPSRPSSTPGTSRPQSFQGSPGLGAGADDWKHYHSGYTSVLPSPESFCADVKNDRLAQPSPMNLDPIHAAALKIMQQFPDLSYNRHSETDLRSHAADQSQSPMIPEIRVDGSEISLPHLDEDEPKPLRLPNRATMPAVVPSVGDMVKASRRSWASVASLDNQDTLTKLFIECCHCNHYHDMPDELYVALNCSRGSASAATKCSWCGHDMGTECCASLSTLVQVKTRSR